MKIPVIGTVYQSFFSSFKKYTFFIVNNINILQGKEKIFVSMPSYKTKQVDEPGKPIYQDVCYPVTKDFRKKLYNEIISEYEKEKDKSNGKARESAEKHHGNLLRFMVFDIVE